jgi:hypothetical protein
MGRYLVTINSPVDRQRAISVVNAAPIGARVEVKSERRSLDQNSKMWAVLTDIATQLPWHGQRLRPDDYKILFLDALKRETQAIPNIEGTGFVSIGRSSSDLSKEEMADLIELMTAFAINHGVTLHDPEIAA